MRRKCRGASVAVQVSRCKCYGAIFLSRKIRLVSCFKSLDFSPPSFFRLVWFWRNLKHYFNFLFYKNKFVFSVYMKKMTFKNHVFHEKYIHVKVKKQSLFAFQDEGVNRQNLLSFSQFRGFPPLQIPRYP